MYLIFQFDFEKKKFKADLGFTLPSLPTNLSPALSIALSTKSNPEKLKKQKQRVRFVPS